MTSVVVLGRGARAVLLLAFVAYLAILGYLVLWPTTGTSGSIVVEISLWLTPVLGEVASFRNVEFVLNVLLFVPLTLLGRTLWGGMRTGPWLGIAFAMTCAIETAQRVFLPQRFATVSDVIANTLGAALGLAFFAAVAAVLSGRRRPGPASRSGRSP